MNDNRKIEEHFLHLQQAAIDQQLFDQVPSREDPQEGAGLIPLLEHMAIYQKKTGHWANAEKGALVIGSTLVVGDLTKCFFVSEEGRKWYREGRGCLLLPFVAHDNRLVGHGLVVFDRALPLDREDLLDDLTRKWKLIFDATVHPLIANLNSAALSALDGFFLGRIRELRHVLGKLRQPGRTRRPHIPPRDLFVLNKMALYELLDSELNAKKGEFRVVFFDLDGFKDVNTKIGHQMADVLLFHIVEELTHPERGLFSPNPAEPEPNRGSELG